MDEKEIIDKIKSLGIITIEPAGELSVGLLQDAIDSTEKLLDSLNLEEISNRMNKSIE